MSSKHVIKLSAVLNFFNDDQNLITRAENALESGHVVDMLFDEEMKLLKGRIHASMKNKQYNVQVR